MQEAAETRGLHPFWMLSIRYPFLSSPYLATFSLTLRLMQFAV